MAIVSTVCPFSKRSCRECSIYRGRHSQLCVAARYKNGAVPKPTYGCTHLKFEFSSELAKSRGMVQNVEDREDTVNATKIVWKSQTK